METYSIRQLQYNTKYKSSLPIIIPPCYRRTREKETYTGIDSRRGREGEAERGTINNYSCYVNEVDVPHTNTHTHTYTRARFPFYKINSPL